jgi:drug/metabolite transporter (DMT)-like permease
MSSTRGKAVAAALGATLGWGCTPVFIKLFGNPREVSWLAGAPELDLFTQTLGRYGAALIALLVMGLFQQSMRLTRLKARHWGLMLIPSVPNIIMQVFWVGAFYFDIAPTMGSLLAKLSTILSLAFTYLFFRDERRLLGNRWFLLMAAAGVGSAVGVVLTAGELKFGTVGLGALFLVGSSIFWALYSVGIKYVMRREPIPSGGAFVIAAAYMVAAFAVMTLIGGRYSLFLEAGWKLNVLLAVSGVVNIAVPHVLYYHAIRRLGVAVTALVTMCGTFVTAALSVAVFGQMQLTLGQILFGLALMASAGGAVWLSHSKQPDAEPKTPLREPAID